MWEWVRMPGWWGRTTLHPRTVGEFSSPHPTGCVPSSTGSNHSTLSGSGLILSPPNPQGEYTTLWHNTWPSNSAGEYAVWMCVSACRSLMGLHHLTLSSSVWIIVPIPQGMVLRWWLLTNGQFVSQELFNPEVNWLAQAADRLRSAKLRLRYGTYLPTLAPCVHDEIYKLTAGQTHRHNYPQYSMGFTLIWIHPYTWSDILLKR